MKPKPPAIIRESNGHTVTFRVEAPIGMIWSADDVHEMIAECYAGDRAWEKEAKADLRERMAYGFEPCDTPDCEWCADARAEGSK